MTGQPKTRGVLHYSAKRARKHKHTVRPDKVEDAREAYYANACQAYNDTLKQRQEGHRFYDIR